MPKQGKLTDEERIQAVQNYLDGKGGYETISKKYGIIYPSFRHMVMRAKK